MAVTINRTGQSPIYRNLVGDPELAAKYARFGWSVPSAATAGGAAGTGVLPGTPGTGGSLAAGQRPAVPDPTTSQSTALAGNLANLARIRQLFTGTSDIAGITPQMTAAESSNINSLLHPPSQFVDINRMAAEAGTATGVAGSPAAETRGYRMTDEERLRRQVLGSQLLNERANRANTILPLQQQMQTGNDRQVWANFANMIAAGADPEEAFQRALQLAQAGVAQGYNFGYGRGGGYQAPGTPPPTVAAPLSTSAILGRTPYQMGTPSPADGVTPTLPGGWGVAYGGEGEATAGNVPNYATPWTWQNEQDLLNPDWYG